MKWTSISKRVIAERIDRVRRFERHYEHHLRKVHRGLATDEFTVADMRVVQELGFAEGGGSGAWLAYRLALDPGYLCRILKKLEAYGLVEARASENDGRSKEWSLTTRGREVASSLEDDCRERVQAAFSQMHPGDQRRLVDAMSVIETMLMRAEMRR